MSYEDPRILRTLGLPKSILEAKTLSLEQARSVVGRWLAVTRALQNSSLKRRFLENRPQVVTKAYLASNQELDIPEAAKKARSKKANAVPHARRSLAFRLQDLLEQPLQDGARILLRQSRTAGRKPIHSAILEIPIPNHPSFVLRFKASYSKAWISTACTTRGHAKRPANTPRTHPWRSIKPAELPHLHPVASSFINALQSKTPPKSRTRT